MDTDPAKDDTGKPVEEVVKTEPVTETVETAKPPVEQTQHVSRAEFDGLKNAIDGLTQTVAQLAPKEIERDSAPGGIPWTHRGHRL